MIRFYCLLTVLSFATVCNAQVEGVVSDAKDNETLPFTHVFNLTTSKGSYTDINGFYSIEAHQGDVLQFSYVGYEKQTIVVRNISPLHIKLKPANFALSDVNILPGKNPAHRIIHHAIANREKNNPDNRKTYSCTNYTKLILDFIVDSSANPALYVKLKKDTGAFGLINETIIKREYIYRDNVSEHIVASRMSGATEYQMLAFIPPMIQFFHFYDDVLDWKVPVKFFLNPISPGSTSKYFFLLRDTIVSGVDSTFIISYQPRRTSNFDGLKGLLYINSNGWAIQNVVAEPADYTPMRLKIQQRYEIVDSVWFPSELSLEWFIKNPYMAGLYGVYRGKSQISEIDLQPDLSNRTFKSRNITIADDAHLNKELIERHRETKLSAREDSTYRIYKENLFDNYFKIGEGLIDNSAIPIKIFDFPLDKFLQQNFTEGFRVGVGMYTNRHLSPWFSIGGYYGYGFNDQRSKYGASLSVFPEKHLDSEVKLWWANDLMNLTMSREIGVSTRKLLGKFDMTASIMVHEIQSAFDYSYMGRDMSLGWERNAEAGFRLRYAHSEERAKVFRRTQPIFTTHPIIYFNFFAGIPDCFGSKYTYVKTEVGVQRNWYVRNLGTLTFALWGGWMDNDAPFALMFNVTDTEQSLFHTYESRTRFNVHTGNKYVYASNQYVNAFLYHDFGTLLFKTRSKFFRPRIAVAQSFGWSTLNHLERHVGADFNILDMRKGYFESGVVIEDIIRLEFLRMIFLGIGGGVYGAYGNSVELPFENTLTPKIKIKASF